MSIDKVNGRVESFGVLNGVDPEIVAWILESCAEVFLKEGQLLLRAGQLNRNMYFVLTGKLSVLLEYPGSKTIAFIGKGETVGELSVIDGSATEAYVVAYEDTRLLEINEATFWRLLSTSHAFAYNMLLLLSGRMRSSDKSLLDSIRLRRRFQREAMVDALTGIHNRRWLDLQLPRLLNRHLRDGTPLSLIMFDIDNFKKFNDRYGHDVGDDVLVKVATTVVHSIRPADLSVRFGGEEFVIVLAGIGVDLAKIVAERLRRVVATDTIVTEEGKILHSVTISLGVTEVTERDTAESVLKRADVAMYRAKKTGRNRTCIEK